MTPYERIIVKTIYPKACGGDRNAIKVLQNLTTKRRGKPKCKCGCGERVLCKEKRFASGLCFQNWKRNEMNKRAIGVFSILLLSLSIFAEDVNIGWKNGINTNATPSWQSIVYASTTQNPGPSNFVSSVAVAWPTTNTTLVNLPSGTKLYFAVYHFDLEDLSPPSNQVFYKTKMNAPSNASKLP